MSSFCHLSMHYAVQPLCKALLKESKQKCHPYRLYLGDILPFLCLSAIPTIYQIELYSWEYSENPENSL